MNKPKGGLGRGLAALIPTGPQTNTLSRVFMNGSPKEQAATELEVREGRPTAVQDRPPIDEGSTNSPAEAFGEPGGESPAGSLAEPPTAGLAKSRVKGPGAPSPRTNARYETSASDGPHYAEIPIELIRPNPKNPRTVFDDDALAELAHSVREFGLLQPIVVRPARDDYELVMGERRWRAAQQAGLTHIPAIVRATEDADLLRDALLENIHRANLNPLEEAAAYQQLLEEFDVTQEELAKRIGRSRPVISNTIRLLKLPVVVQRRVAAGVLSAGHARALLGLDDANEQEELAARVVAEGISVRGTEEAVVMMAGRTSKPRRNAPKKLIMPSLTVLAATLSDTFDTRVKVELGRQKGKIVVEFATVADLERIVAIMAPAAADRARLAQGDE